MCVRMGTAIRTELGGRGLERGCALLIDVLFLPDDFNLIRCLENIKYSR